MLPSWHHATIVTLNKPNKPDYSNLKAYHPISLLECIGKVLEKVIAKRFNHDIEASHLLPMTQFGSCHHHTATNTAAVLTHRIQATRALGHAGTLVLFDISGFFDNLNPQRTVHILRLKGFPDNVCWWMLSFLTERTANLRMGTFMSDPFPISYALLGSTQDWVHRDLTIYVNDGAIYAISATTIAAATSTVQGLEATLQWLHRNSLTTDPNKTELITFMKRP